MEEEGSFKSMTCQPKGAANGNWVKNTEQKCSVGTGNNVKSWENVEAVQGQKLGGKITINKFCLVMSASPQNKSLNWDQTEVWIFWGGFLSPYQKDINENNKNGSSGL